MKSCMDIYTEMKTGKKTEITDPNLLSVQRKSSGSKQTLSEIRKNTEKKITETETKILELEKKKDSIVREIENLRRKLENRKEFLKSQEKESSTK